jgi:hypothetical protein
LALSAHFSNSAVCPKLSDQQIDFGAELRTDFKIDTVKNKFEGALLFELKRHVEFYDQYNTDAPTVETNMNDATHVHMIVGWKVKNAKPYTCVALVEHAKELTWNEEKLKTVYDKNHSWLKEYDDTISETWCMNNNMIMKMSFNAGYLNGILELSISISEEEKDGYAMRPFRINPKR